MLQTTPTAAGSALLCHSLGRDDFTCLFPDETIDPERPSQAILRLFEVQRSMVEETRRIAAHCDALRTNDARCREEFTALRTALIERGLHGES